MSYQDFYFFFLTTMSYYLGEISENTIMQESIKLKDKEEHRSKKKYRKLL